MAKQGRAEAARLRKLLDNEFSIASKMTPLSEEQSRMARYLAIRVSACAESCLTTLCLEYCQLHWAPAPSRLIEHYLRDLWGINRSKLEGVLQRVSRDVATAVFKGFDDEIEQLNSVGKLRDNISHGGDSSASLATVLDYKIAVYKLLDGIEATLFR